MRSQPAAAGTRRHVVSPLKPVISRTMLHPLRHRRRPRRGHLRARRRGRRRGRRRDLDGVPGRAGVLALFTAYAYAELVTKYPQPAARRSTSHRAFRTPFLTFMVAFAVMCSGITSASTLVTRLRRRLPQRVRRRCRVVLVGIAFIALVARDQLPRHLGVREAQRRPHADRASRPAARSSSIGLALPARRRRRRRRAPSSSRRARRCRWRSSAGASLAFFALIGFEDSVNVAEETQDPAAQLPARALRRPDRSPASSTSLVTLIAVDGGARPTSSPAPTGRCSRSCRPGPLAVSTEALLRDRPVRARQRRADQHDHGLAAPLRHGRAGDRADGARAACTPSRRTPWVAILFTTLLADAS